MRIRWERNCLSQNGPPPSAASGKHGDSCLRFNDIRGTAITMLSRGRQYATADYSSDRPLDLDHFSHNWKLSAQQRDRKKLGGRKGEASQEDKWRARRDSNS